MVRINLINPKSLTDQHLIAEYDEILMLIAYVKKYPCEENIPEEYCLGKGHMRFFKNKLLYIKKRHELLKKEMIIRGFKARKNVNLKNFKKSLLKDWEPKEKDVILIKKRILQKICLKPRWYRYNRQHKSKKVLMNLLKKAKI